MAYIGKRIKNIGDKVSYKFPKLKFILKPIYHILFYNRYGRKRRESYLKNAHETICKFNECMRESNIEYSLAYGTMLGAIRERGFIKPKRVHISQAEEVAILLIEGIIKQNS
jgi:hypothetical protein